MNFAALIAGFHGAQHTAAFGDALEFLQHSFFDQISEFFDDEGALTGVFIFCQTPFAVDDQLNRQRAAYGFISRRGDRFVVGIGMQRVAIVVNRNQRLQRGADVIEINFLCVQGTTRGLNVIFQFLRAVIRAVFLAHGDGPQATRHSAEYGVLRIHAIGEEERQIRCEIINRHATREIRFNKGEAIGERERQLRNRIRARFGDVIARD